jgi:hypothetical protein
MRHVKVRWGEEANAAAIGELITASYREVRARVRSGARNPSPATDPHPG